MINYSLQLFNLLLEKRKNNTINKVGKKILSLYLQLDVVGRYPQISFNYLDKDKIRNEVKNFDPNYTGHEDFYWFCYHYEAFGNSLYSFKETWKSMLMTILGIDPRIKNEGFLKQDILQKESIEGVTLDKIISEFLENKNIKKILKDRGNSVHGFGDWRSEIGSYTISQDWQKTEFELKNTLLGSKDAINKIHELLAHFVFEKIK